MIDLTPFQITTPHPKPDSSEAWTVPGAQAFTLVNEFCYPNGPYVVMWAPTEGASTPSVLRTRTEWMTAPFLLSSNDTHTNHQVLYASQVNHAGKFVCSQMHDQLFNDPTCKVFWDNGKIFGAIRTTDATSDPKYQLVLDNVPLNTPFTIDTSSTRMGLVSVSATCTGRTGTISDQITGSSRLARQHVFHGGAYNQVDRGLPGEVSGEGTRVEIRELVVTHADFQPDPAAELLKQIDAVAAALKAIARPTALDKTNAQAQLNILSKDVAAIPDDKTRAPLYAAIKTIKAQM